MRRAVLLGATITFAVLLPSAAASGRQKPYVLTGFANIGTVYWRYDCVHHSASEWSLAVRVFRNSATTAVRYRDARLTRRRTAQPDGPSIWFPFRRERSQSLTLVQFTEPGTLRGRVVAKFSRHDCRPYFPPRLSVHLYPR